MTTDSSEEDVKQIMDELEDPSEERRMSALQLLTSIGHLAGVWQALRNDNRAVSHTAIGSLIKLKSSEYLCRAVQQHDSATVRRASVHALKDLSDPEWIREAVKTDDLVASFMALCVLANLGDDIALQGLSEQIRRDDHVPQFVAKAAANIGCGKLVRPVVDIIESYIASGDNIQSSKARETVEHLSRILDKDRDSVPVEQLERIAALPDDVKFWRAMIKDGKTQSAPPISIARWAEKLIAKRKG